MIQSTVRTLDVFSLGLRYLRAKQFDQAQQAFAQAVATDPSMCDGWLGQLAAGHHSLAVVEGAYKSRSNLGLACKASGIGVADLGVSTSMTLGAFSLGMPTYTELHVAIAYAVALAEASEPDLALANEVLERTAKRQNTSQLDRDLLDYIRMGLLSLAKRWPDVLTAESQQHWSSKDNPDFLGFLNAGMLVWKVWALLGTGNPEEARRYAESGLANRDLPPEVHARLRLARGYALRALGLREEAAKAFSELHAWVGDTPEVRAALDDPDLVVELVTASSLATRSDVWDPGSGRSARDLQLEDRERRRDGVRAEAMALLDAQIGMEGVKEQIRRLESKAIMDQKRAAMGISARDIAAAYIFTGPPGTGKTTMAKALAQLLFGLGVIAYPEVIEVGRGDLIGEHLGETAPKTKAVINKALGRLLFIDEAYALTAQGYSKGDAYGEEAVTTLLARMENERLTQDPEKKLVVVIAGYEADIDRFLASNEGLASRFTTRIHFTSYSPDELVQIACAMAEGTSQRYSLEAQERLRELLTALSQKTFRDIDYVGNVREVNGIDKASNARFVRTLTEKAPDIRDDRLVRTGADLDDEALAITLEAVDAELAFQETCAVQKIPFCEQN